MALRISRAIPYFCGLPYQRRMARRVVTLTYTCFVDDSGNDGKSPFFVLGAWIARVDAWEFFSNVWDGVLMSPRPLRKHNGKRYFRHTDALNQRACFAGFTAQETAEKMISLAGMVKSLQHHMLGYTVTVPMIQHKAIVQANAIRQRGGLHRVHTNPFYLAFQQLVPDIYESCWNQGERNPVDIIVDGDGKTDKAFKDMKATFDYVKEQTKGEPEYAVFGDILQRSGKDLAPLQLADMLAGQARLKRTEWAGVWELWKKDSVQIHNVTIGAEQMKAWAAVMNATLVTKRLQNITARGTTKKTVNKKR